MIKWASYTGHSDPVILIMYEMRITTTSLTLTILNAIIVSLNVPEQMLLFARQS